MAACILPRAFVAVLAIFTLLLSVLSPSAVAQVPAPAPAPTSDGASIDQGIAYVLMLVALVLTYLIHSLDASSSSSSSYAFF